MPYGYYAREPWGAVQKVNGNHCLSTAPLFTSPNQLKDPSSPLAPQDDTEVSLSALSRHFYRTNFLSCHPEAKPKDLMVLNPL